jgi:hypothetical protein
VKLSHAAQSANLYRRLTALRRLLQRSTPADQAAQVAAGISSDELVELGAAIGIGSANVATFSKWSSKSNQQLQKTEAALHRTIQNIEPFDRTRAFNEQADFELWTCQGLAADLVDVINRCIAGHNTLYSVQLHYKGIQR